MALRKKRKIYFFIVVLAILAIVCILPQFFFEKPPLGYGDKVEGARRDFNLVTATLEKVKAENGTYMDSIEPVISMLFSDEEKKDLLSYHPKYSVDPDKNSFELSFVCVDPVPITSTWSSSKKIWAILIDTSSENK